VLPKYQTGKTGEKTPLESTQSLDEGEQARFLLELAKADAYYGLVADD
jgi:hypothetical protein